MATTIDVTVAEAVRETAHPLAPGPQGYDPLMDRIGDARFVLLGEASHGTHDFYHERAQITRRLIDEKGFTAVAVEADWPDAFRVDRYVRGVGDDADATEALAGFRRFPTWMWRNTDVVGFVEWLRARNDSLPPDATKAGFYGLDLYSLRASMDAVLGYLEKVDAKAAARVRQRYACFDHFGEDTQVYGFLTGSGVAKSCEEDVLAALVELQRRVAEDESFDAVQNARLVKNAEAYYRAMVLEEVEPLRDPRLERAIGVIYRPDTERASHYFGARLTDQFDAVLHFDETRAVEPLERTAEWAKGEPPETYPFGL
jgi:erythromycin esterase-like protein